MIDRVRAIGLIVFGGALIACGGERLQRLPPRPDIYLEVPDGTISHDHWLEVLDDGAPAAFDWDWTGESGPTTTMVRIHVREGHEGHEIAVRILDGVAQRYVIDPTWQRGVPAAYQVVPWVEHVGCGDGLQHFHFLPPDRFAEAFLYEHRPAIVALFADGTSQHVLPLPTSPYDVERPEPVREPKDLPAPCPTVAPIAALAALVLLALHRRRKRVTAIVA
jgi:MYXO-CTERM domain-containing protein